MKQHDQPENNLVGNLRNFVPDYSLCEESAGPSADQFREMECKLRSAPLARLRAALVAAIDKKRENRNCQRRCRQKPPIDSNCKPAERVNGKHQQQSEYDTGINTNVPARRKSGFEIRTYWFQCHPGGIEYCDLFFLRSSLKGLNFSRALSIQGVRLWEVKYFLLVSSSTASEMFGGSLSCEGIN